MTVIAFWEIIILFFLGLVSIPMPLSVPPMPEDPKLLRAAPAESIAYFSWFGRAKANPQSQNKTERLAAEPQMRNLVLSIGKALKKAWEIEARDDAELAGECFNALALVADRPGCVFVSGVDLPPKPFSIRAGLVANLGARGALLTPTLRKLETWLVDEMTGGNGAVRAFEPLPGLKFRGLPMPEEAPPLSWGVVDGYLVVALGKDMAKKIAAGLRGAAGMTGHAFFKEVQSKVRVARPCFRTFIDLQKIIDMAGRAGGKEVARILELTGLSDLQLILSETGLEGEGFVARSMLATKGRSGFLKLVDEPPLSAKELAIIPGDATLASAIRVSPKRLYNQMLELIGAVDPRAHEQFQAEVAGALEEATGLDLEKDLLAHMGDTFALWNSPGQGGLLFTGLTLALELDNSAAFARSFEKAMGSLLELAPKKQPNARGRIRRGVYIETIPAPGTKIYFVNTVGDGMPFAPAWCVTNTHLLVSLFPQMLMATISRGPRLEGSLATHPRVRTAPEAVALTFMDGSRLFDSLYPALHLLAQLAAGEMQRQGMDIHIGVLPTADSIKPHMTTETSTLAVRPDGLLLTRKGTIPILDPVLGMAMPLLGAFPMFMLQQRQVRAMQARRRGAKAEAERRRMLEQKRKQEEQKKKKDKVPL